MPVDLLSEVLTLVRMAGCLISRPDIRGWRGIAACPTVDKLVSLLPPGTDHIISFHVLAEGAFWIRLPSPDWTRVQVSGARHPSSIAFQRSFASNHQYWACAPR